MNTFNILLVEDSDTKATRVKEALQTGCPGAHIRQTDSYRGAIQELSKKQFDLLVLDMVLPTRSGEVPDNAGGQRILSEIHDDSTCIHPKHIICLTAFESVAQSFKTEASRRLVHLVVYSETSNEWREALVLKTSEIVKRVIDANKIPEDYLADLAIITSSPRVELSQVLGLSEFQGEYNDCDALHYYRSNWVRVDGQSISVVACAAPTMGMTAAAITASKVINRWRPKYLAMSGIAAGTKADQQFGDILIAESAYDYGSGKISGDPNGNLHFTPSFKQIQIDARLHALLQRWEREQLRIGDILAGWKQKPHTVAPRIQIGVIATGAAVIQHRQLVTDILERSRKDVGLEMEAFGVMHAAFLASKPAPRVIVAKSVSDFADQRKDDSMQDYAAYTSARFLYEFFCFEAGLWATQ